MSTGTSSKYMRMVWSALDGLGGPATAREVAESLGAPLKSVGRALSRMELDGYVRTYDRDTRQPYLYITWNRP